MKKITLLLLPLLLASCQYFDKQVPDEDEFLQQRLKEIDWKKVSSYPSLAECDAITDKDLKKECFFSTMTRLVQEKLDTDTIAMLYPEIDTIQVKVTVYPDATLKFEPQIPRDSVKYDSVKIDSIIKARLVDFPKIEPAQKEGIPVTTEFILPVILDVK
ncbi:hypothetical protein Q765_12935 [Flavobacterium rivuli WB 3.3-2 = DSM 21788]|uniref:TonB C-terminal domain-containing protein n=1 Tax=Flavobacterium rivuli WB 3.3-2 = DSM 21788 TaxID=1121895 RepID=A0A0A2M2W8_9FLAO|nr:hypothetical protein [Flavobacterium rivuli]KGO85966.1 hypothetical protein Q765_12935 [Flavobacterium rivuli WB 3.3-2 = DSM 21788]